MDWIDSMAEGQPDDTCIESWYQVARDQWQLMELRRELHRGTTSRSTSHVPLPARPPIQSSFPFCTPAPAQVPAAHPLPLGVPMEVDASRQRSSLPLLCRRCGRPGHFARYCPQGLEVRYLSAVEQEELLLQLLAARDAQGNPSPDAQIEAEPLDKSVGSVEAVVEPLDESLGSTGEGFQ